MKRLRRWLEETHSAQFELVRHFAGQFFESEFVAQPGQLKLLFAGVLSVLASLSILFLQAYYHKYLQLGHLDDIEPFRRAVLADELFLVSLNMAGIGLLTTMQWQSLFPSKRDYLALAGLPLRMGQVFRAKFAALFGFVLLAGIFFAGPPSAGVPAMMAPQRGTPQFAAFGPMGEHVPGIFAACLCAGLFVFFSMVAVQGVLLNVLPLRVADRVLFFLQALLLMAFMAAVPVAIAIPNWTPQMDLRPEWIWWAPPVWFLGIDQWIVGGDVLGAPMARIGIGSLLMSAGLAVGAYWWSYRRHRVRILESAGQAEQAGRSGWTPPLAARTLAVYSFIEVTLARSSRHRLILVAFAGMAVALSLNGVAGALFNASRDYRIPVSTVMLGTQLVLSLFVLAGLQYLFRLPVEPRANWLFRIHEPGYAPAFIAGIEAFLVIYGVGPLSTVFAVTGAVVLGVRQGLAAAALGAMPALLLVELILFPHFKIPFTSLYLPARRVITETLLKYIAGFVIYVSFLSAIFTWCIQTAQRWTIAMGLLVLAYAWVRRTRLHIQRVGRMEFEELPEVAVQVIGIYKD